MSALNINAPATHASKSDLQTATAAACLRIAFIAQPTSLIVSTALATLVALVMYIMLPTVASVPWYGVSLAITASRTVLLRKYRRTDDTTAAVKRWSRLFFVATLSAGAAWGSLCVIAFPHDGLLQMMLAFTLAGTTAGAVTSLSSQRAAAIAFVTASTLPLAIRLLLLDAITPLVMGGMVLVFLIVQIGSINRLHRQIRAMVTAQLQADAREAELQIAKLDMQYLSDRMRIATSTAKAGVWEWDVAQKCQVWDAQVYQMYGVTPDSQPPSYEAWRSRVHPQDLARIEALLRQSLASGHEFTTEFRVLLPDGTERNIQSSGLVQRDADGHATRMIGMNWNITDLRRVDRMKSEFVSIVSHELRTPLTSIRAALGLVAGGAAGVIADKGRQMLQLASRNADRLGVLIDDILDIDKIESGKLRFELTRQPLQDLLEQSLTDNATYAAMHTVTLELNSESTSDINVDSNRMLQVLANLLSNAVKFSPAGSVVTVNAREIRSGVRIEVHDSGPGITPEYATRIFGKFSQGDSSDTRTQGGTGLGLAISKAIVEQMEGHIGFDKRPGGGTTFYVELPLWNAGKEFTVDSTTVVMPQKSRRRLAAV